jgi:site-specific recombinase XerC
LKLRRTPQQAGPPAIGAYLDYLALERNISPATQSQALNALAFLTKKVFGIADFTLDQFVAARGKRRPPTVMTREWVWQYLFASATLCPHPRTGRIARHHLHETSMQRQFKDAVRKAGLSKRVTCHTMRHCFATHLLESGMDIRTVQSLMGHGNVETTMIYLHVMKRPGAGGQSPLDLA